MKQILTLEQVERWRDKVHRRRPSLAVSSKKQALNFVNSVGFCFAFKAEHSELPCLWHATAGQRQPTVPAHTHIDPAISFVWEMKEVLPAERRLYYGRLLKHRPTMVSLEYLPYFYALSGRSGQKREYTREFTQGKLTRAAKEVMDALMDSPPQNTKGLKLATGLESRARRVEFDKALSELQEKMFVVKIAEEHGPFSFVWAPMTQVFPEEIRKARRISTDEARERILDRYFRNQYVASVAAIHRLFRWNKQEIFRALGQLMRKGIVGGNVRLDALPGNFYCLSNNEKHRS